LPLCLLMAGLPFPAAAGEAPQDSHPEQTLDDLYANLARPLWHVGALSRSGALISGYGKLGFVQFCQEAGLDAEFGVTASDLPGWAAGLGLAYQGALPSAASATAPLILPGFDAAKLSLHASLILPASAGFPGRLVIRTGPHAAIAQIQQTGLTTFWLGADLSASEQFSVGPLGLEAGIAVSAQFRKDLGATTVISVELRAGLFGENIPAPIPARKDQK
jgi:hypothetical protein